VNWVTLWEFQRRILEKRKIRREALGKEQTGHPIKLKNSRESEMRPRRWGMSNHGRWRDPRCFRMTTLEKLCSTGFARWKWVNRVSANVDERRKKRESAIGQRTRFWRRLPGQSSFPSPGISGARLTTWRAKGAGSSSEGWAGKNTGTSPEKGHCQAAQRGAEGYGRT